MKPFLITVLLAFSISTNAETLFGPGSINIATNEAILINTVGRGAGLPVYEIYINGNCAEFEAEILPVAIAGPRSLAFSNQTFITFQKLQGSSIKTLLVTSSITNIVSVPDGKTIQFFNPSSFGLVASVHPSNSTNVYEIFTSDYLSHPAITGPVTIEISTTHTCSIIVSYYFTDEVLQMPPAGLLHTPAPTLEINIEKSYNLTNWIPTGAFNTEAENGALYRLRILR